MQLNLRRPTAPCGSAHARDRPQGFFFSSMKTILLVDDDSAVRRMLSRLLTEEHYTVVTATNGQEALDLAQTAPVDLVLLDLNLPMKDGWETFERLSTRDPFLPVVIITARSNQIFPALASGAG